MDSECNEATARLLKDGTLVHIEGAGHCVRRDQKERVLKELSVLPETRHLIAKILSPTSALIRKNDLDRLRKELRELGYLLPEESASDPAGRG